MNLHLDKEAFNELIIIDEKERLYECEISAYKEGRY